MMEQRFLIRLNIYLHIMCSFFVSVEAENSP